MEHKNCADCGGDLVDPGAACPKCGRPADAPGGEPGRPSGGKAALRILLYCAYGAFLLFGGLSTVVLAILVAEELHVRPKPPGDTAGEKKIADIPFQVFSLDDSEAAKEFVADPESRGFAFVGETITRCGEKEFTIRRYRHLATAIEFALVPGGRFMMGATQKEIDEGHAKVVVGFAMAGMNSETDQQVIAGFDDIMRYATPRHETELGPYLIAIHELTQSQWKAAMGSTVAEMRERIDEKTRDELSGVGDDLPMVFLSWDDCQAFCKATGLEMPSEAQWEFACRAGSDAPYCFGESVDELALYAHYFRNSGDVPIKTTNWVVWHLRPDLAWERSVFGHSLSAVGRRKPSAFGIHDMHGNAVEWCLDIMSTKFYGSSAARTRNPVCLERVQNAEPLSVDSLGTKVQRGGDWHDPEWACLSSYRLTAISTYAGSGTGFRPACSLERHP